MSIFGESPTKYGIAAAISKLKPQRFCCGILFAVYKDKVYNAHY